MTKEDYGKEFYERAIEQEGVDYNFYGDWQINYAKMVISITDILKAASDRRDSTMLDIGCACGVTLRAFKETKVFGKCIGVDISEFLINKGKETHGFTDNEMIVMDITKDPLPFENDSITLINCTHTLEHIKEEDIDNILEEMYRVLEPEVGFGFVIVPAVKPGNPISEVAREQSHYIVQTMNWWRKKFTKKFSIDNTVRKNFKETTFSPLTDEGAENFYHYYNQEWTIFGLKKEK